jgi:hypothetical protein
MSLIAAATFGWRASIAAVRLSKQLHCELELGVHGHGGALVAAEIPEAVA